LWTIETLQEVVRGNRESPVDGTPPRYIKLFQNYWEDDPNKCPKIESLFNNLKE
ncbi:12218_t:CDS:1, partial [Dentiscutata heterogama]